MGTHPAGPPPPPGYVPPPPGYGPPVPGYPTRPGYVPPAGAPYAQPAYVAPVPYGQPAQGQPLAPPGYAPPGWAYASPRPSTVVVARPGRGVDAATRRALSIAGTVGAVAVGLFSALAAVSFAGIDLDERGGSAGWAVVWLFVALVAPVALVWRARYPVAVCLGTAAAALVVPLDAFAPLLALTWVIARRSSRTAVGCAAATALATAVSLWRDHARDGEAVLFAMKGATGAREYLLPQGYVALGLLALAVAVAVGFARRNAERARQATGVAADHARTAAQLRTELSRQEERELIAREMHDTVAHHLSLVSLHASALEATAGDPATDVPAVARSMRDSAHQALEEMRTLVASLRDAASVSPSGPAPALGDLPRLVDAAREAGADVTATLFVSDEATAPPALTRAVYRIVQESLTNALKHAPGQRVELDVRASRGAGVEVVVRNRTGPQAAVPGAGAGLLGMRERAAAVGGSLEAGEADGWFSIRVHLPWSAGAHGVGGSP